MESASLENLPNLGPKSCKWLREVGITTIADLEQLGAVVAYRLVRQQQARASLNLLWALEAGLLGMHWRDLTEAKKQRLLQELDAE